MPDPERSPHPTNYIALLSALWEEKDFSVSPSAERTVAYCVELANFGYDFKRMRDSLIYWWADLDSLIEADLARGLLMNKFLVAYTEYNTAVWAHAYRERLFQLTNAVLDLGVREDKPGNIKLVTKKLREKAHLPLLRHLESLREDRRSRLGEALKRRNDFIHRMPEQAWESLRCGAQLQDWLDYDEDTGLFQSKEMALVDPEADYLEEKRASVAKSLESVQEELDIFEEKFCALLYAAYSEGGAK